MATLDAIKEMKKQGYQDEDIVTTLEEQGVSSREINDALNQSKVKQAVSDEEEQIPQMSAINKTQNLESTQEVGGMENMQPSVINQPPTPQVPEEPPLEIPQPGTPMQTQTQEYAPAPIQEIPTDYQDQGFQNQGYGQQFQDQDPYGAVEQSSDMVSEIANQLITEKLSKTNETVNTLIEFKSLLTSKVEKIDDRLKQIESIIDQLQMSLLRKANQQEQNVQDIKTEMQAMQSSFGKMLNPLTDTIRDMKSAKPKAKKKTTRKKTTRKKKK